jgi:hypothetical protein
VDAETFQVAVETFDYKVKGASFERPPERTESFRYFSGYGDAPKLRCDRKVAQTNGDGCVLSIKSPRTAPYWSRHASQTAAITALKC